MYESKFMNGTSPRNYLRGFSEASQPPPELLRNRDNFPSLEEVFAEQDGSDNLTSFLSNSMDYSIGTRAALNCHLRHVSKFGIDGDGNDGSSERREGSKSSHIRMQQNSNVQNDLWERILEGDLSSFISLSLNDTLSSAVSSPCGKSNEYVDANSRHLTPVRIRNAVIHGVTIRCQEEYACGSSESPHQANRSADVRNDSDVYLPLPDKESSHISVLNLSRISHDESQYTLSESPIDCVEEVSPGRCQIAYTPTRQSSSEFRSLQLPLFHEKENAALGMVYPLENSDIVSFSPISSPNRDHFTIGPGLWHHKPEPIVRDPCPHPQPTHTGMPLQDQQKVQLAPSSETKSDNMLVLTRTTSKHAITSYDIPSTFLSQTQVDRRRFRTVVPRRVFMNDPSDFLEYGDSFAPPTAGPSRLAHDTDISTLRK